jgi:ABC-type uncharacterized transport system substrate-binding protein
MMFRSYFLAGAVAALMLAFSGGAQAHPHVWITVKSDVLFSSDGKITALRYVWTFDDMYSAFATQGLDKNNDGKYSREELTELAEVNVTSLEEFKYFTVAKSGADSLAFGSPKDYWLEMNKDILALHFTLPLAQPAAQKDFSVAIFDSSFFVDLSFPEGAKVELVGAPATCTAEAIRPQGADAAASKLSESFFDNLSASAQFGSQFASRIVLRCK